tara:strand:- start:987 stop:1433 length:447 start_codon:yes stop_codon:yes gene_type:complete
MAIQTSAGTTLSLVSGLPATYNQAGFEALTYAVVGEITEIPSFGSVYNLITHSPLGERRVIKRKGSINDGAMTLSFAADASDAGQIAAKASAATDVEVSVRITYPDGEDDYFTGLIMSYQASAAGVDSIKTDMITLELTNAPVNVAAS